jgi:putative ABC transport system permease protein
MSTHLFFFALDVIGFFSVLLFGLNGHTASTTQGSAYAQLIFDITVTVQSALIGITMSCIIGFLGGLFSAIRAARLPVATALRAA